MTERENPSDGKRFEVRRKRYGVLRRLLECRKGIKVMNVSFSCKSYNSPSEWHWTPIGWTPRAVLLVVAVVKAALASKERGEGEGGGGGVTIALPVKVQPRQRSCDCVRFKVGR